MEIPSEFKSVYSSSTIQSRVTELGAEITAWAESAYKSTGEDAVAVPVLRGALFFFADLVRHIGCSIEMVPTTSIAYDPESNTVRQEAKLNTAGALPVSGRKVLLVDDICDSGLTLRSLVKLFKAAGATEVKTCALIVRKIEKDPFEPDYVGFTYPGDEWLVGYGMDDKNRWRNLDAIYRIERSM